MAFSFQPFFPQSLVSVLVANVAVTTTTNVVTGGVNGTKIEALILNSTDTIDHNLTFAINVSGTYANIGSILVPANTGNVNVLPISVFANAAFAFLPQDPNGNKYLYLANASCSLVATSNSVNGTAKVVSVTGHAANY